MPEADVAGIPADHVPGEREARPEERLRAARALTVGSFPNATATADFNGDGWIDIFVANDGEDNLLWMNQRDGTLRESALLAGVAVTAEGKAEASMGVDAGDFDNDGWEDLYVTYWGPNVLYRNVEGRRFEDVTAGSGTAGPSKQWSSGCTFIDYDRDGYLDLFVTSYQAFDLATAPLLGRAVRR